VAELSTLVAQSFWQGAMKPMFIPIDLINQLANLDVFADANDPDGFIFQVSLLAKNYSAPYLLCFIALSDAQVAACAQTMMKYLEKRTSKKPNGNQKGKVKHATTGTDGSS
jgi:hypothetical protein